MFSLKGRVCQVVSTFVVLTAEEFSSPPALYLPRHLYRNTGKTSAKYVYLMYMGTQQATYFTNV